MGEHSEIKVIELTFLFLTLNVFNARLSPGNCRFGGAIALLIKAVCKLGALDGQPSKTSPAYTNILLSIKPLRCLIHIINVEKSILEFQIMLH